MKNKWAELQAMLIEIANEANTLPQRPFSSDRELAVKAVAVAADRCGAALRNLNEYEQRRS